MSEALLAIGTPTAEVRRLAELLGAELLALPAAAPASARDAELERWRARARELAPRRRIVVAAWRAEASPGALLGLADEAWCARAEDPLVDWMVALGSASALCADGGSLVAVVERPAPLDASGWVPEAGVADAVEALVRSLARSEGPRGVRVNAVATPVRLVSGPVVAPAPPLAAFPGALEREVVGAVRLLLGDDACGLTGSVLAADCGRSW